LDNLASKGFAAMKFECDILVFLGVLGVLGGLGG